MNNRILFIPLDDRPCTLALPVRTAKMADIRMLTPPREVLGKFHQHGNCDQLIQWLENIPGNFDGAIISVDMALYGGLVASRKMADSTEILEKRLEKFMEALKKKKKNLGQVYLFATILRVAPTYTDESRVPIIQKIVTYSGESYHAARGNATSKKALEKIRKDIPAGILEEYLAVRNRNFTILKQLVNKTGEGIFDLLHLGIDDSKTVGLNVLEREELEKIIKENNWEDKVTLAPGADEAALLLLSRLICRQNNLFPRVQAVYSDERSKNLTGRYEDRSFEEIVRLQTAVAGGIPVGLQSKADIMLFVHTPDGSQKEASTQKLQLIKKKPPADFISLIKDSINNGEKAALADVHYANGADHALLESLMDEINIFQLSSFAAWNTAGNTLGTAIAQGIINLVSWKTAATDQEKEKLFQANSELIMERLIDDWLYQSGVRQDLSAEAFLRRVSIFHLDDQGEYFQQSAREKLETAADELMGRLTGREIGKLESGEVLTYTPPDHILISLPWDRLFEVSLDFESDMYYGLKPE